MNTSEILSGPALEKHLYRLQPDQMEPAELATTTALQMGLKEVRLVPDTVNGNGAKICVHTVGTDTWVPFDSVHNPADFVTAISSLDIVLSAHARYGSELDDDGMAKAIGFWYECHIERRGFTNSEASTPSMAVALSAARLWQSEHGHRLEQAQRKAAAARPSP